MQTLENVEPELQSVESENGNRSFFTSPKGLIVFILSVLIIGAASFSFISPGRRGNNPPVNNPIIVPTGSNAQSSNMIVYGVWKDKSYIKTYDTGSKKEYILAELPINIKKVTLISSSKLLYINGTDDKNDHGRELAIFDIPSKSKSVIKADENFEIDDYVISDNKKYVAIWEVSFKEGSDVLFGGRSRVYSVDLLSSPIRKNVIYDEVSTIEQPVHFPVGITNEGRVFLDTFFPNSGSRQWAYGMSVSNFDGSLKKEIQSMKNGTYATIPSLSSKGDSLVFAGFDGTMEEGRKVVDGMRKAVSARNTVEFLKLNTATSEFERTKIPDFSNKNEYDFVYWEPTGNIIVSLIPKKGSTDIIGKYVYVPETQALKKLPVDNYDYVSTLSNNVFLLGQAAVSISAAGNLGEKYSATFSSFYLSDNNSEPKKSNISDSFMQYITNVPPGFFNDNLNLTEVNSKTLQLKTFALKPSLAPKRENQQTNPVPRPKISPPDNSEWCSNEQNRENPFYEYMCEGNPQGCRERELKWIMEQCAANPDYHPGYELCYDYWNNNSIFGCMGTPLYLYGNIGTKVNVKVKTYVYSKDPVYTKTGYDVKILNDGEMEVSGKVYDRIDYEYSGTKKVTQPTFGTVVEKEELEETLVFYAKNLGLNEKETEDLVQYGVANIKSPYVFVSYFDQEASKQILPLEFTPKPDTYINIVFYFKELSDLPQITPTPPSFPNIPNRYGLTAVEISEVVER